MAVNKTWNQYVQNIRNYMSLLQSFTHRQKDPQKPTKMGFYLALRTHMKNIKTYNINRVLV